jgi:very-short-patch-repair endonuclease
MSWGSAVDVVARCGGVARTAFLRRAGVKRRELADAVHGGELFRPRKGLYALPTLAPDIAEALSHCGMAACVTAARAMGLWVLDEPVERVHVWVRAEHRPTRVAIEPGADAESCCVFHRDSAVDPASLTSVGILHCLVQLLRCRGEETFFAALESALRQRLIGPADRDRLRASVPSGHRWLVDFARTDADSGLESLLRLRLHRCGLSLASQVPIPGVGIVDFVIGDCLILEADGGTHDGPARHSDRVRDAVAASLGFITLRFDYAMIVHDWPLVEAAVLSAVGRNLHRSHAGLTW